MNRTREYLSNILSDKAAYQEAVSSSRGNPCMWIATERKISRKTLDIFENRAGLGEALRWANEPGTANWRVMLQLVERLKELKGSFKKPGEEVNSYLYYEVFTRTPAYSICWKNILPMLRAGYNVEKIMDRIWLTIYGPLFNDLEFSRGYQYGTALENYYYLSHKDRLIEKRIPGYKDVKPGDRSRLSRLSPEAQWVIGSLWLRGFRSRNASEIPVRPYEMNWEFISNVLNCKNISHIDFDHIPIKVVWKYWLGRIPEKEYVLRAIPKKRIANFNKGTFRCFLRLMREYGLSYEHDILGAAVASQLFPYEKIVRMLDDVSFNMLTDLRKVKSNDKELLDFIFKYRKRWDDVLIILPHFNEVKPILEQDGFNKALAAVQSKTFANTDGYEDLATELAKWGHGQDVFSMAKHILNNNKVNVRYESIPDVKVTHGEYALHRLDKTSPINFTVGNYTNCCQAIDRAGESCCFHAVASPDGATYVLVKDRKIVGTSWVWRTNNTVVFDNCELLSEGYRDVAFKLYTELSKQLVGNLGIEEIRIGGGYDKMGVWSFFPRCHKNVPTPDNVYTDAWATQHLILSKDEDKNKLVRDWQARTGLDIFEKIRRIEQTAYPEELRGLQHATCIRHILDYLGCAIHDLWILSGESWYALVTQRPDSLYIGDLASENKKLEKEEWEDFCTQLFPLIGNKTLICDARESTSYRTILRAQESGLINIVDDFIFEQGGEPFHKIKFTTTFRTRRFEKDQRGI